MKKYQKLSLEIIHISEEDILWTSLQGDAAKDMPDEWDIILK